MPPSAHCSAVTSCGGVRSKSGGAADSSATLTRSHLPRDCRTAERARPKFVEQLFESPGPDAPTFPAAHACASDVMWFAQVAEDRRPQLLWVIVWTTSVVADDHAVRPLGTGLWISNLDHRSPHASLRLPLSHPVDNNLLIRATFRNHAVQTAPSRPVDIATITIRATRPANSPGRAADSSRPPAEPVSVAADTAASA